MKELTRDELIKVLGGGLLTEVLMDVDFSESGGYCYGQPDDASYGTGWWGHCDAWSDAGAHSFHEIMTP